MGRLVRCCSEFRGVLILGSLFLLVPVAHALPAVQYANYRVDLLASGIGAATGLAVSPSGDLFLTDYAAGRVLRVPAPFSAGPNTFEVYATGLAFPNDLTFAFGDRLFVTSSTGSSSALIEVMSDGSKQVLSSGFSYPVGIAAFGDFAYVGNSGDGPISKVDSSGIASTFLSGFAGPHGPFGVSFDAAGNLYFVVHGTGGVYEADPGGTSQLLGVVSPLGGVFTAATSDGAVFVSDVLLGNLYLLDDTGLHLFASGFAGKSNAPYNGPNDVILDGSGAIYVADASNVWRITPVPEPATLALLGVALAGLEFSRRRRLH